MHFFKHSIFYLFNLKLCTFPRSCCRRFLWVHTVTVCLYVCVGAVPYSWGERGGGMWAWAFLAGFFACFLSNLGDILDLFSSLALCCSCPSHSAVVVMWVVIVEGWNLASPLLSKRHFLFRETGTLFYFLNFFCVLIFFSSMLDGELNVKETNPEQIAEGQLCYKGHLG